ncbi:MAG TPA: kelch repeat-containing protein [Terriglobales bacterium]|nr:kelch repeat-containing protein [Terriglobales bacterium]
MKFVSRYLWVICSLAALFTLAGTLKASLPQSLIGAWTSWSTLSQARANAATVRLPDGRILIEGGDTSSGPLQSAEIFATDGTLSSATSMNSPRSHHFAVVLSDGRVLVGGGMTTGGGITNSAEIYDPATDSWSSVPAMITARANATAVLLQDGRVLIAGGDNSGGPDNTLEIYDPATVSFDFAGQLSSPRTRHAMAVLQDGRVLIVGGYDGNNPLALSDVFDPASNAVSAGPSLATSRYGHSATTLLDGRVAVIGGTDGANDLASAEIFDPASGGFSNAGAALTTARHGHQAFLLPNNNGVLIVGGSSGGVVVGASELFIPQISPAGVWSSGITATGSNLTARNAAVGSAMKQDGLFLAAGGNDSSGNALASTELYAFPTVTTDQADYAPGSMVTITGSGWQPGENVTLTLVESPLDDTHPTLTATADANGNIVNNQFSPDLHDVNIRFFLTAVGGQSGRVAMNTFTDAQPSTVVLTPSPITVLPGGAADFTITVNFNGNNQNCTVNLSLTGLPTGTSGAPNPLQVSGNSSATSALHVTTTASGASATPPGSYTLTVTGTPSGCQNGAQAKSGQATLAVAGNATHLSVAGFPSPVTAGTQQTFTVTALDANDNIALGFTGTVSFSSSDSQAVLPANYTFVAADGGAHQFNATLKTAGTQSITASASGVTSGSQTGITVSAGAAAQLAVTGHPSPVTAGTSNSFTVTAQDAFGNLTTGYTGTVHFSSSDLSATLPANHTFTTGQNNKDNGVATFNATFNTAGIQSLTATDTGTSTITGTQSSIVVNSATVATSLSLAVPNPASVPFGSTGPVAFTATLTRTTGGAAVTGATVNFTVDGSGVGSAITNGSGVATFSTYNPSALSVAGHNVQASFAGATISSTAYAASTSSLQTLTVTQASQTIIFAALSNKNYGDAPFTVSATGGASGNPVTFTASPAGVCSSGGTNGSTITITGAGNCTVTAHQAGNANYAAATDVPQSFTVNPATPTVTVTDPTPTYDGSPHAATATAVGVDGHTAVSGTFSFTYDGSSTAPTNAKTSYAVVASFTSTDANYTNATGNGTLTIKQASSTTTVTGGTFTFDGNPHAATVAVSGVGGLNLTPSPNYSGACSAAPVHVAETPCTASYTFAGDTNHTGSSGSDVIVITKAPSSTVVSGGGSFVFDGNPHAASVAVTGVGGLNLTPSPNYSGSCSAAPVHVAETPCTASYTFAGDGDHFGSSDTTIITITKAPSLTVVSGGGSFVFDGNPHAATVAVTGVGGLNLTPSPNYSGACSAAPVHVAETPCTASYTFAGDGDHLGSSDTTIITITKAPSSTTISAGFTVVFDGSSHGVSANVTGAGGLNQLVPVTYTPGGSTVPLNPGSYTAMATFAGDSDHLGSSSGSVTINITFNAICAAGLGDAILPPINSDGTSVYQRKGGSTIPVKFRVCGANGAAISNASLVFGPSAGSITMLSAVRGTVDSVNESTDNNIPDVAFRWDSSGQQWIFNMATSNLTSGSTYAFRINLAYAQQSIVFVVGAK